MSEFQIYSKAGCGFCDKLIAVMEKKNIPYHKFQLGVDYKVEDFLMKFGRGATFPRVVYEGEVIGGMKETVKFLVENNYA